MAAINGRRLVSAVIDRSGDSLLTFSDDLYLRTFVIATEEDANWNLRDKTGNHFHIGPDRSVAFPVRQNQRNSPQDEQVAEFFVSLSNSETWRVSVDVQHRFEDGYEPSDMDSMGLEFRRRRADRLSKVEYEHIGSMQVDVNTSGLRLERSGEIIVASGDSSEKVLSHFKQLVGKSLLNIEVATLGGDTSFIFEDELLLRCFPATSKVGDVWRIFSRQLGELIMGPGGRWSYAASPR